MRNFSPSKLHLVGAMVILANVLDLASTYAASPDLANEWNALERVFGLGWPALIIAKLLGGLLAIAGYAYYMRNRETCYPLPGARREAFCRHLALGPAGNAERAVLVRHLGVGLGYFWAGMQGLVFWVALDNWLLLHGIASPVRAYSETGYHALQSAIVASTIMLRFQSANYRHYLRLNAQAPYPPLPLAPAACRPDGGAAG